MKARKSNTKKTIGRSELIDLPDWDLVGILAKTDTGAYTSSIHCHEIELVQEGDQEILEFKLLDPDRPQYHGKVYRSAEYKKKVITNSFGQSEERFVVTAKIKLFGIEYLTEFSLTDRGSMKFPVLLGRKLLRKRFLVNVDKKNLSYRYLGLEKAPKSKKKQG
jgi:hypothetical protein